MELPSASRVEIFTGLTKSRRDYLSVLRSLRDRHGDRVVLPSPLRRHCFFHPKDVKALLGSPSLDFGRTKNYDAMRDILGDGLLTADGEVWRKQRQIAGPELSHTRAKEFGAHSARSAEERSKNWSGTIDVFKETHLLTLKTAGESFFGSRVDDDAETIRSSLHASTKLALAQLMCPAFAAKAVTKVTKNLISSHASRIDSVFEKILATRSNNSEAPPDLFARLLKTPGANPRSVRDQAVTFLLAGHETTSIALGWLLCLLAKHPRVQSRFREAGADSDDARAIVRESLRLYPSVPVLTRLVRSTLEFDGLSIATDEQFLFSPWVTQRHPDFWPDADRFDPDRSFGPPQSDGRYFPFGLGPRECIGKFFATEQMISATDAILKRYELSLETLTEFRIRPQATLQPAHPITLRVRRL